MKNDTEDKVRTEPKEVLVKVDRSKYVGARSASGSKSLNNGDPVAVALIGLDISTLQSVADKICGENDFRTKYAKLNVGMQRMNIGNRIRGACAKIDKPEGVKEGTGVAKLAAITAPFQKEAKAAADKVAADRKEKAKKAVADKAAKEKKESKAA